MSGALGAGQDIMTGVHEAAGLQARKSGDGQNEAHVGSESGLSKWSYRSKPISYASKLEPYR